MRLFYSVQQCNALSEDISAKSDSADFRKLLELITHADDSRRSKAFIRVCVRLCVCVRPQRN